jgi:hypothetical protein
VPIRVATCRLCRESIALFDAPWVEQVELIDVWSDDHGQHWHGIEGTLPVRISPEPMQDLRGSARSAA